MPATDAGPSELRIRRIGQEIFARAAAAEPSALRPAWWQRQMLDLTMQDESFKTRLFRFIECLPRLNDSARVARHLRQYLNESEGGNGSPHAAAGPLQPLIDLATAYSSDSSTYARLIAFAARFGATQMAGTFIAGSTADEAITVVRRLRRAGQAFTLDVLGETVLCQADADYFGQLYLDLIADLSDAAPGWSPVPLVDDAPWGALPRINVSVKLSAFSARFDALAPRQAAEDAVRRLRPILIEARRRGAFVNVDLEHHAVKDLTYDIFMQVLSEPDLRDWPDVGIVMQAYLRDAERDLLRLTDWVRRRGTPIAVRLVKGAYWDYETAHAREENWPIPVWTAKWESDRNFERLSRILLENHAWTRPAFASHNVRSLAFALAAAEQHGLPPRSIEIQMLYGMGDPLKRALVDMQQRVRVYTPFGRLVPGMAYFIRRLLENTANEGFLRQSFSERLPVERLLASPAPQAAPGGAAARNGRSNGDAASAASRREPALNFIDSQARDRLAEAIRALPRGAEYRASGSRADSAVRDWRELRNPSRPTELTARVAMTDTPRIRDAVDAAIAAQRRAAALPIAERTAILSRAASWMRQHRFAVSARLIVQLGRAWRDADAEVAATIDALECSDPRGTEFGAESRQPLAGEWRPPAGVWALATSFEHPLALPAQVVAAAIAAGSAVVWAVSPLAAGAAAALSESLQSAGAPLGLLNLVFADDAAAAALLRQDGLAFAAVAGRSAYLDRVAGSSTPAGSARIPIARRPAGVNSVIVDESTNLDHAALGTLAAAFTFAGQSPSSCRRVVVVGDAGDEFSARLTAAAAELTVGPADDPAAVMGPLIDVAALEAARRMEARGRELGRCLLSPAHPDAEGRTGGWFFGPVLFAAAPQDSALVHGELVYGEQVRGDLVRSELVHSDLAAPILTILRAADLDEAMAIANAAEHASVVHLYSRTPESIRRIRSECRAGLIHVNRKPESGLCERPAVGPLCDLFQLSLPADQTASGQNAYNSPLARSAVAAAAHASVC